MHDLLPITPLWGTEPRVETYNDLAIREVTALAIASLAVRREQEAALQSRAAKFLGFELPGDNRHVTGVPFSATWMAPGQWFVMADIQHSENLDKSLKAAVGDAASVTEQTDAWCCFAVDGPNCLRLFEKLTAVDLSRVSAGYASRLRLEHLGCLVICLEAGQSFLVLAMRSLAVSLFHALEVTAKSL